MAGGYLKVDPSDVPMDLERLGPEAEVEPVPEQGVLKAEVEPVPEQLFRASPPQEFEEVWRY